MASPHFLLRIEVPLLGLFLAFIFFSELLPLYRDSSSLTEVYGAPYSPYGGGGEWWVSRRMVPFLMITCFLWKFLWQPHASQMKASLVPWSPFGVNSPQPSTAWPPVKMAWFRQHSLYSAIILDSSFRGLDFESLLAMGEGWKGICANMSDFSLHFLRVS